MKLGVSYLGAYLPKHLESDLEDIKRIGFDDVIIALQENDFQVALPGKVKHSPVIAHEKGLRIIANFWGFACTFGGGRVSKLLTDKFEVWQRDKEGQPVGMGCLNNPGLIARAKEMVDECVAAGYDGFFWDEPPPQDCYCFHCQDRFQEKFGARLFEAKPEIVEKFRVFSAVNYVRNISAYVKSKDHKLYTGTCVYPGYTVIWDDMAKIEPLDSFGTDPYWLLIPEPIDYVRKKTEEVITICKKYKKTSNIWLLNWAIPEGKEEEVVEAARILKKLKPDCVYVWLYLSGLGTNEVSANPVKAWKMLLKGIEILKGA